MERIWRLLVAIFFLCAGLIFLVLALVLDTNGVGVIAIYAALVFIPIGLIKGIYDVIKFGFTEDEKEE